MAPARTPVILAAMLLMAASSMALAGQRAKLGVGLTILPACPPSAPPGDDDSRSPPGPATAPMRTPPDLERLRHCAGQGAREVSRHWVAADHPPAGADATSRVVLIEF